LTDDILGEAIRCLGIWRILPLRGDMRSL